MLSEKLVGSGQATPARHCGLKRTSEQRRRHGAEHAEAEAEAEAEPCAWTVALARTQDKHRVCGYKRKVTRRSNSVEARPCLATGQALLPCTHMVIKLLLAGLFFYPCSACHCAAMHAVTAAVQRETTHGGGFIGWILLFTNRLAGRAACLFAAGKGGSDQ